MKFRFLILIAILSLQNPCAEAEVVPTPQYLEPLTNSLVVKGSGTIEIVLSSPAAPTNAKMKLAAELLRESLIRNSASLQVKITDHDTSGPAIHLWNWAGDQTPPTPLNLLDRQTLSDSNHWGQSYVIRLAAGAAGRAPSVWALGSSEQGVLFAAMTLLQSIRTNSDGLEIHGMYVRDYPHFEFRAAADWLLTAELNRWCMDRGQGIEAYRKLCKQKLDLALRYKINMIFMDGFGWGLKQRFDGYGELMRDLNAYARARGIHLVFGGYGASYGIAYQTGPIYEEGAYLGEVFKNRESYPDGPTYSCLGYNRVKKGMDASILGSCRSNEELNKLKAEELRKFVEAVEPGVIYIHHEDFGLVRSTEEYWQKRCPHCRKRWPNDSLAAKDGGAGALANGYASLVKSVNSVKNSATGYNAARDCQIILVSPVYVPDSAESDDWAKALEVWKNIAEQFPRTRNVQICFREVFPQKHGTERWTDQFNLMMKSAGKDFGLFLFFAGGADNWISDYPLTGVPAMNAMFRGARTIYNFTGDSYREPMQIINAEYSWNYRSTGFFTDPFSNAEANVIWRKYIFKEQPEEVFGPGKLYERACNLLYGAQAGPIMASYYRESAYVPDPEITVSTHNDSGYVPMDLNRTYALPSHWRDLALDSKTWGIGISNEVYASLFERMKIERKELHRRLARRWKFGIELNEKAAADLKNALAANPSPDSIEDLRFFEISHRVYQPLIESLAEYHIGLEAYFSNPKKSEQAKAQFSSALPKARRALEAANQAFPHLIDPIGGEGGAILHYTDLLVRSIEAMQKGL